MLIHNAVITGSLTYNGVDLSDITASEASIAALNQATASLSGSIAILSSSYIATSASYVALSGSFVTTSQSMAQRVGIIEGKYVTTGSNSFSGSQVITGSLTGSSALFTGAITAQTLVVQTVTSSVVYSSGSNTFGNQTSNVQAFTGSLRVTGSGDHYIVGGNVGIGTTSTAFKLEVQGNTNIVGTLNIFNLQNLQWNGGDVGISNDGTSLLFKTYSSSTLNTKMRLDSSGNLGLGVTPSAFDSVLKAIQISGTAVLSGQPGAEAMRIGSNWYYNGGFKYQGNGYAASYNQSGGVHYWYNAPNNTSGAGADISFTQAMTLFSTGNLAIGLTSDAGAGYRLQVGGAITSDLLGYSIYAQNSTGNRLIKIGTESGGEPAIQATLSNGTARQLSLNPSGGNVGIGTANPLTVLDLATGATNALGIGNASTTISSGDLIGAISFISRDNSTYSSGGVSNIRSYATATYNTSLVSADLRFYVTNGVQNTAGDILFGSEAMRITSAGTIGINNTNPLGILHATSAAITAAAPSLGWPVYNAEADANSKPLYIDTAGNGNVATAGYGSTVSLILGSYWDSRAVITTLGAGSSSPSDQGTGYGKDLMIKAGTSDNTAGRKGGKLYLNGGMGYQSAFNTNVGDIIIQGLGGGGNVGIGTTSPTAKLQISGSATENLLDIRNASGSALFVSGAVGSQQTTFVSVGTDNPSSLNSFVSPFAYTPKFTVYDDRLSASALRIISSGSSGTLLEAVATNNNAIVELYGENNGVQIYGYAYTGSGTLHQIDNYGYLLQYTHPSGQSNKIFPLNPGGVVNYLIDYYTGNTNEANSYFISEVRGDPWVYANGNRYTKFTSSGSARVSDAGTYHEFNSAMANSVVLYVRHQATANPNGIWVQFSGASPDNNTEYFFRGSDPTAERIYIYSDGDLANHDGVYGTISDVKLKQDIVDASSQWEDIKNIRFRKYRMKSDVEKDPNAPYLIGVVAQELELTSPGLVESHPDFEEVEIPALDESGTQLEDKEGNLLTEKRQQATGTETKTVKSSILLMKAAKALQEALLKIEELEERIKVLENK